MKSAQNWLTSANEAISQTPPDVLCEDNYTETVELFNKHGVYYSAPLDLDMMMIQAFNDAYAGDLAKPDEESYETLKKHVFGDKGAGSDAFNSVCDPFSDSELFIYKKRFKSSSKPVSHIDALSKLSQKQIKKGCPEPIKSMVTAAKQILSGEAESGETE